LEYAAYSGFLLVSVAMMAGLVVGVWRRRPAPGATEFAIHTIAVAAWALSYALEIVAPGLGAKLLFAKLSYLGVAFVPVTMLLSTRRFVGRRPPLRPGRIAALCALPLLTLVFTLTNGREGGLQWASVQQVEGAGVLRVVPGPWYWISATYGYALYLTALVGIVGGLANGPRLLRRQSLVLLIASIVPAAANLFYLSGISRVPYLDLTPFAFGVSTGIFAWYFRRLGFFDLVPVAREILVEEMRDGLIVLDWQGRIVDLNPAAERLLGLHTSRALGRRLEAVLPEADEIAQRLREGPGAARLSVEVARPRSGELRWLELAAAPLRDRGRRLAGDLVVLRDVTDRVASARTLAEARDQALAADKAKSEFLANMSHEIRTPMNGIIGMTDILLDSGLNEDQRDFAGRVRAAAENLLTILNDILDFSKIEAGKLELEQRDFELRTIVEEAVELMAGTAYEKGLKIASLFGSGVPERVVGDPGRTRQVLLNLLSNAVKFTDHGEVVVRIELAFEDATSVRLRCEVRDTGIGIPEAARSHLFDPFSQVHASSTSPYGGTGLGLAIVKRLVEMQGGEVGFDSRSGDGSVFWFTLRLGRVDAGRDDDAPVWARSLRVLCVDDSAACRAQMAEQLASAGLAAEAAPDATQALARLRRAAVEGRPFDVLVLDDTVGETDSLDFARRIRRMEDLARPSIIVLAPPGTSAADSDLHAVEGFVARVRKPTRRAALLARIRPLVAPPIAKASSAS
jgi:PAS domain S-box-containing protein